MKKTDNYSLPQWEKQDFIKMEDFNDAFGKTDAALKANADATATGLNAETAARGEADAAHFAAQCALLCVKTVGKYTLMTCQMQLCVFILVICFLENSYVIYAAFM